MKDLILINPSYFTPGQSERRREQYSGFIRGGNMYFHPFEPPLGLASLAAYLALKGYSCELVDMPGDEIDDEGLRERLRLSQPRLIGITAMTPTERRALEIAELCKSLLPEVPIISYYHEDGTIRMKVSVCHPLNIFKGDLRYVLLIPLQKILRHVFIFQTRLLVHYTWRRCERKNKFVNYRFFCPQ